MRFKMTMRKRIQPAISGRPASNFGSWMDLESCAEIEITSEDPAHPIEAALVPGSGQGWKASQPGKQTLRIIFDSPQQIRRIHLLFTEHETTRTQEFVLRWSPGSGHPFRDVVRQHYNLTPKSSEVEDYTVELNGVEILELEIVPSISGGDIRATLEECRLR
jgi:hypothetical protein